MRTLIASAAARPPRSALLALIAALLVAAGCASSGPYWSPKDKDVASNAELQERIASLERQLTTASQRNAALQAKADGLERALEQRREPVEIPADRAPQTPEVMETVPAPRERFEIEQSDLGELEDLQEAIAPKSPTTPGSGPEADPRELYESSLELLEQRRLSEAEAGFTRFLSANPDSDLADNAQFWLAECALRRADVPSALAGFRAVVENYPEGNKVPDALLKVGYCLATAGDAGSAATVYRELVARFPQSAAAETARQRLGSR